MDIREEFNQIIEKYGFYCLMQRTSRQIRCVCWNEKEQESSVEQYMRATHYVGTPLKSCPRCLGKGWISRMERHKVRRENAVQAITLPFLKKQMTAGQVASDSQIYYMRWDTVPKKGDVIYEVGWDFRRPKKPTHLIQAFEISQPYDYREVNGRVGYYSVATKEVNFDTDVRDIVVRKLGAVENYEFVGGNKRE